MISYFSVPCPWIKLFFPRSFFK